MELEYFVFLLCFPGTIGYLRRQAANARITTRNRGVFWTHRKGTYDPLILPHYYSPNYGYEAYWANGDWLIRNPALDLKPNQTTTKIPLVCGEECDFMDMRIKEVCGHRSSTYNIYSCRSKECNGELLRDMTTWHYKTFNTYCEFLNHQCKDHTYRWGLLYRGACIKPQALYLKPLLPENVLVSRMQSYLTTWQMTYNKMYGIKPATRKPTPPKLPSGK